MGTILEPGKLRNEIDIGIWTSLTEGRRKREWPGLKRTQLSL